jgi:hypothetical protein
MPPQVGGGFWSSLFGGSDTSGGDDTSGGEVKYLSDAIPASTAAPPDETVRPQIGGGGGGGGYGFALDNTMGKVYADLHVGACPQRGGAQPIDSYPAGYGFAAPASVQEVENGTAHFLTPISYGKQCMGGGARRATRGGGGSRRSRSRKTRRGRKGRKARRSHRRHH